MSGTDTTRERDSFDNPDTSDIPDYEDEGTANSSDTSFLSEGEIANSLGPPDNWGRWLRRNSSKITQEDVMVKRSEFNNLSTELSTDTVSIEIEEGLIVLVGPEKYTQKVSNSLEQIVPQTVRVEQKSTLTPEEAGLLKHEDFLYILYVMDASNPTALKTVDEELNFLQKNYSLSFDCIDFILAKQSPAVEQTTSGIDLKTFMEKYERPVITVTFSDDHQCGDEINLTDQMTFFLRRFQLFTGQ